MSALRVGELDAALAGTAPLPRANGELVFEEPWHGRALGLGVVVLERTGTSPQAWSELLGDAIAARPGDPDETAADAYYAAWLDALERLLGASGPHDPSVSS